MAVAVDLLHPAFTFAYLVLGLPLVAVELYGVWRRHHDGSPGGDTISENWYYLRKRAPWLTPIVAGFLLWLTYHFTFEGW